ncbi:RnfABCDGE type electron transport complex subunit D [Dysgonomonas sp. 216]|uniref:RnfABCDGE type electron transport complex subunit D n=1 Tax=Dysgonomonas sp. 216 TaxID=2302934 RepID=UPI0013D1A402|nr:RnfABCDGE type electron transport complex subunit D [Dysgonomonas sp. 216]NDW17516.1 RnfABCDGE type electron transport complex subunit D [Dysgonomonas sp. 216]
MSNKLIVSPSPHIHSGDSIEKNMYGVLIALIPAFLVSLVFFGLGALIVTTVSVVSCIVFEALIQKYLLKTKVSISDGSAIITGILLAFNLPSNLPVWIVIIGAFVAIAIGKMTFGGLGNNIFNPALVGRVFLLISFPAQMTVWPQPGFFPFEYTDATTGATTLSLIKHGSDKVFSFASMLIGEQGGSLGEVSAIALLIGFGYMLWKKIITWHIPVFTVGTVMVFTGILHLADPHVYADPVMHLLSGGLLLGAIFMATDYATSPMSKNGMIVYAIGIGLITAVIRIFGVYPEGISFAILIMNALTPLINTYIKPKRFGEVIKNG